MRIDPGRIDYLRLASSGAGGRMAEAHIRQIDASIAQVATRFELPPDFKGGRMELS